MRNRFSKGAGAVVVVASMIVAATTSAVANHVFPDSTDSQAFHDQVANVAGAGCATGFPDGTFDPTANVKRQQFAAWMNRCGGRVGHSNSGLVELDTSATNVQLTSFELTAGAVSGTSSVGGFVVISADGWANTTDIGHCPCAVALRVGILGGLSSTQIFETIGGEADDSGAGHVSMSASIVAPIGPDETVTIEAVGRFVDDDVAGVDMRGQLTAVYVPFGPDGDNTLQFEG
jgi:hypothetical protein